MSIPLITIANWKMNLTRNKLASYFAEFSKSLEKNPSKAQQIIFAVPAPFYQQVGELIADQPWQLAAQNLSHHQQGAFTGEISAQMLTDYNVKWVIVGHSERRQLYLEDDHTIAAKVVACQQNGLDSILCIGENLQQRESGQTLSILEQQLTAVAKVTLDAPSVIAYEPVWAIGTGLAATAEQIQTAHEFIHTSCKKIFTKTTIPIPILYGGSVKPQNVATFTNCSLVHGTLVGGASLNPENFAALIASS